MNDSLFLLNVSLQDKSSYWTPMSTALKPSNGIYNYGITATPKGRLALYGGITNAGNFSRVNQTIILHSELWYLDLNDMDSDFTFINLNDGYGGISRMVLLEGEIVCIMNRNINNQMLILDLEKMHAFEIIEDNSFVQLTNRESFGVFSFNRSTLIVIGGVTKSLFNMMGDPVICGIHLEADNLQFQSNNTLYFLGILAIIPVIFGILYFKFERNSLVIEDSASKSFTMTSFNDESKKASSVNSTISFIEENRTKNDRENISDNSKSTFISTKNLTIPPSTTDMQTYCATSLIQTANTNLAIPVYLKCEVDVDYSIVKELCVGGFGMVSTGILLNEGLANEKNNGDHFCVIKTPFEVNDDMFFQELSIHEVFKKEKYFSRLLCYSDNPHQIVLRYYRYGSLFHFIYSKKQSSVPIPYDLETSIHLAERMTYAFRIMHSKGYIHNDIKLANILLDEDKDEPLFPVITDFGITHILDTAKVVSGFRRKNIKAGTPEYCAPEVLLSFQNNEIISNVNTDVYSLGIVLIELFTRRRAWKEYKAQIVLQGGFPDISVKKFLDNYENITKTIAVEMLRLILLCIEYDADKRPLTNDIHERLKQMEKDVKLIVSK
jgi:hypothetical protein